MRTCRGLAFCYMVTCIPMQALPALTARSENTPEDALKKCNLIASDHRSILFDNVIVPVWYLSFNLIENYHQRWA